MVVIYHDYKHPQFWSAGTIKGTWPNSTDAKGAIEHLRKSYEGRSETDTKLHMLQATLTPDSSYIATHLFSGIKELSSKINKILVERFDLHRKCNINVIMYDFVEYPELTEGVIYHNRVCMN